MLKYYRELSPDDIMSPSPNVQHLVDVHKFISLLQEDSLWKWLMQPPSGITYHCWDVLMSALFPVVGQQTGGRCKPGNKCLPENIKLVLNSKEFMVILNIAVDEFHKFNHTWVGVGGEGECSHDCIITNDVKGLNARTGKVFQCKTKK